jgi:cell division cycle 14
VALSSNPPRNVTTKHFFSIDTELVYWNFYLDFGPLNLGQLYRFCEKLNKKLDDPRLKDKAIYFYSGTHGHRRANAAYLICSWSVLYQSLSPEEAFRPFRGTSPFPPWHDATPTACTFTLTILDTLKGLCKARECNFFNFDNFDIAEYEHYEKVENGDLNWCLDGKFIAFAGPHATRMSPEGI